MSGRGDLRSFFPVRKGSAFAGSSASKQPVPDGLSATTPKTVRSAAPKGSSVITPKSARSSVAKKPDSGTTDSGSAKNAAKSETSQTQVRVLELKSRPPATKEALLPALPSSVPKSQISTSARQSDEKRTPSKTSRAEFLKLRQKIGSAAIVEFHVSCEELQKSPEKLQKSPFYSPHKTQLTTAQATTSIRAGSVRRKLFSDFFPTAEPGQGSNDDGSDSVIQPGGECTFLSSGNQEKATPRKRQLSDATSGLHEYASPQKVLRGTPAKGQSEKEAGVARRLLSPGRKISVFSPAKGHVYETIRTAADVHAEAVCNIISQAVDPSDAFLRRTMEPKAAISRTETPVPEPSRISDGIAKAKAWSASKEKYKLLHDGDGTKAGLLHGLPDILTHQRSPVRTQTWFLDKMVRWWISSSCRGGLLSLLKQRLGEQNGSAEPCEPGPAVPTVSYMRQAAACATSTGSVPLRLPKSFKKLADVFRCFDLTITYSTSGSCCFERLRQALLKTQKVSFTFDCLGQILAIFPEAYTIRPEKVDNDPFCPDKRTIQRSSVREHYVLRGRNHEMPLSSGDEKHTFMAKAPPLIVAARQRVFNARLLALVQGHHVTFLRNLLGPTVVTSDSKFTGWHDDFPLENVPLPDPAELPPFSKPTVPVTYEQMKLNAAKDKPMFPSRPRKSTEESGFQKETVTDKVELKASDETVFNDPAFKDMGETTIARVRQAQIKKEMQKVMKDPKVERRKMLLGRMVEMGSILLGHFASEKKEKLFETNVVQTMKQSMKHRLSANELQEYYDLFAEVFVAAEWLTRKYVKDENVWIVTKRDHRIGLVELEKIVEAEYARLTDL